MKLVSGIVDSGFFAQSALSAEVATKDSLGRNISETYLTGVDLTPYQTTADMVNYQTTVGMTAYQSAGEYYSASNPSGFLVADDITGKLDASVYAADSGNFLTAVGDTYLQNTDLTTIDGKVTAISGIPLSAGGDVPEGVMVESGLEYNAVQEISGYNGSAIAQYGAEKQFLVHDDTLCHLSNSAQFALGVNLSAVAQLLGVDETVLFDTTAVNGSGICNLTESLKNFKRIKVLATRGYGGTPDPGGFAGPWSEWETDGISADGKDFHSIAPFMFEGVNWKNSMYSADNTYTILTWYQGQQTNIITHVGSTANSYTGCVGIKTVIGIGRKQ